MKENLLTFSETGLKWLLAALIFLVPIFFLTTNFDFFEYPKTTLIWTSSLVLAALWFIRYASGGKVKLNKTPLDLPWIILLVVIGISAYLSAYKYPAIFGAMGRANPSLVAFVAYFLIYYIGVNTVESFKDVKRLLIALVAGSTTLAVVTLLQFLGVFSFLYTQTKLAFFFPLSGTNPAASTTSATVALALVVPIILGWLAYNHRSKREGAGEFSLIDILLTVSLILIGSVLVIYNILPAWITLITGLIVFAFWQKVSNLRGIATYVSITAIVLVVVALLTHLPFFKENIPPLKNQPKQEVQLGIKDSWVVSVHAVRDLPFFGTGLGSYSSDFTRYRQVGFNLNPNWNLRFNTSFNDYFNYLAMLGIFGVLAWLFLVVRFLRFAFTKSLKSTNTVEHSLIVGTTASVIAFLVGTLFTSSTSTVFFTFIVASILTVALEKVVGHGLENYNFSARYNEVVSPTAQPLVVAIPAFVLIGLAFFFGGKTVLANYHYRQALNDAQTNKVQGVLVNLGQAIKLDPYVDLYHSEMARSSFVIASALARKPEPTDQDKANVQALARQAISQATIATSLDPVNVGNWETLASIYRSVSGDNQQVLIASLQSLAKAIDLDPANPQLRLAIGGIFYAAGQYDQAAQIFAQAVNLKPDFANARYNYANALIKQEKYDQAFAQYEAIKKLVQPGTADYDKVNNEVDQIRDKLTTQPSQSTPTQTSPTATGSATP